VSDIIIQGNHVGNIFKGSGVTSQAHGVEVQPGGSDRYIVASNTLTGNAGQALVDGGTGADKEVSGNVGTGRVLYP
jgi:hypothetical protein